MVFVTIVEDQSDFREALLALVNSIEGFCCEHAFASAEEALETARTNPSEIFLLDINLPGLNGIQLLRKLKARIPKPSQYLMCTSYDDEDYVFAALKAGAHGYILKNSSPREIMQALHDLHNGGAPMSSAIARKVIADFHAKDNNTVLEKLTNRELDVLELLSKGHIYKEVASKLGISIETVRKHCYAIYEKLHVDNRMEAVNKYLGR